MVGNSVSPPGDILEGKGNWELQMWALLEIMTSLPSIPMGNSAHKGRRALHISEAGGVAFSFAPSQDLPTGNCCQSLGVRDGSSILVGGLPVFSGSLLDGLALGQ